MEIDLFNRLLVAKAVCGIGDCSQMYDHRGAFKNGCEIGCQHIGLKKPIPAAGRQVEQRAIALGQQVVQHDDLSVGEHRGQLTYQT